MTTVLDRDHWGLHGGSAPDKCENLYGCLNQCEGSNVMAERNYPCDSHIRAYFGDVVHLDDVGDLAFRQQLYYCTVATTIWLKSAIEEFRSSNSFGLLVWQLNENWPTGGWGLLEYETPLEQKTHQTHLRANLHSSRQEDRETDKDKKKPDDIDGARWKPIMNLLQHNLFQPVFCSCGHGLDCYCRNNGIADCTVRVIIETWDINGRQSKAVEEHVLFLPGNQHSKGNFFGLVGDGWCVSRLHTYPTKTGVNGCGWLGTDDGPVSKPMHSTLSHDARSLTHSLNCLSVCLP